MTTLWESALDRLRDKVSEHTYEAWLAPLSLDTVEGSVVRLRAPSRFFVDWISKSYLGDLVDTLRAVSGDPAISIEWSLDGTASSAGAVVAPVDGSSERPSRMPPPMPRAMSTAPPALRRAAMRPRQRPTNPRAMELPFEQGAPSSVDMPLADDDDMSFSGPVAPALPNDVPPPTMRGTHRDDGPYGLNPRYEFDNFVVGTSNQLAHAAAQAAATSPGKKYNPLFIYSKVGLGKTHLVNAVGHRIRQDKPEARILFLSAERFTNEFIWALQNKRIDEFRNRYRITCDVLVIDDIQFLAGREQTQEEFFHTFNALYHADKQIVVTSDISPQQIVEMQERLISRFQWGLVADIQAPELDTRIAILQKKAVQESIDLAPEVALFVAQMVQSNVRELEGTLLRLVVRAELEKRPVDLALAQAMLGAEKRAFAGDRQVSVEDVQRASAEYFGIGLRDLRSERRHRAVALPRMVAMYVAREKLKLSYPDIGMRFGGKDHTTVMNAHRRVTSLAETDENVKRAIEFVTRKLGL
jgi:chromosomal replication initiator protein